MNNKQIITKMVPATGCRDAIVSAYLENDKLTELSIEDEAAQTILHQIYVGKVQNIVPNINAAFIEIQKGLVCYYSLEDYVHPYFTDKKGKKPLTIGDELLVQVVKEGIKTKAPVVTTNLSFTGKYVVLTTEKCDIGVSNKLPAARKSELKSLLESYCDGNVGVIVRTNAGSATDAQILDEFKSLQKEVQQLLADAVHRTCYSLIYKTQTDYITKLINSNSCHTSEIVTDSEEIYLNIEDYFKGRDKEELTKLRLYQDIMLPLNKLYNIPMQIEDALRPRVWLKSGAYLIIEQTEAFTVIDVNTGKFDGKKKRQDTFYKINVEAAKEIARQLRLRNLSGIILVDFINMESKQAVVDLLQVLEQEVKKDSIKTDVVDITKLGIVELTRKKERKSLSEIIGQLKNN